MTNATVRAAGSGLPSAIFNRRRMLLGLAAASTAAAAPVAAAAGKLAPAEVSELLELGTKTAFALSGYQRAAKAREVIVEAWTPQWPAVPKEIALPAHCGRAAPNLEGSTPWNGPRTYERKHLLASLEQCGTPRKWRRGTSEATKAKDLIWRAREKARYESQLVTFDAYDAECARLVEASGIRRAQAKENAALRTLKAHVGAVMALEPSSMAGILIQAEALAAIGQVPQVHRVSWDATALRLHEGYGERIAASILRIAGQS